MFTHLDAITPVDIKSTDSPRGRFYITPTGSKYPSITTVLGAKDKPWLREWRMGLGEDRADKEMKRAADRGTAVHAIAEKFLNNDPNPTDGITDLSHLSCFNQIRLPLRKINNILTQESALWSDDLQVAGRVDCVAEYRGKLAIVDFKTSTNDKVEHQIEDYYLQTTGYALMFEERYGIQIDNLVIIMAVEKGAVPLVFEQTVAPYVEPLLHRINNFNRTIGVK